MIFAFFPSSILLGRTLNVHVEVKRDVGTDSAQSYHPELLCFRPLKLRNFPLRQIHFA